MHVHAISVEGQRLTFRVMVLFFQRSRNCACNYNTECATVHKMLVIILMAQSMIGHSLVNNVDCFISISASY